MTTDPFANACALFAGELARLGIDPAKATIVLPPEDHLRVVSHYIDSGKGIDTLASYVGEVECHGLHFLPSRRPI